MSDFVPSIGVGRRAAAVPSDDSALERACEMIVDAGHAGARWAIFPTGYIPGYPDWVWAIGPAAGPSLDALRAEAWAGAVCIPSDITDRLCAVAQRARVNVAIGLIERDDAAGASYFNTVLVIDRHGQIVGTYRALLSDPAAPRVWDAAQATPSDEHPAVTARVSGI
jgi:predicted amidohydrolase